MTQTDLDLQRLFNQRIVGAKLEQPEAVVRWMGAIQAQDYAQQMGFDLEYVQDATATMQPRENAAIESQNLPDVLFAGMDMMAKARRSRTVCRRHRPGRRAKWDYGRFHQGGAHFG